MIRSNSKKARERVDALIMKSADHLKDESSNWLYCDYDFSTITDVSECIMNDYFFEEYLKYHCRYRSRRYNLQELFFEYASGLPLPIFDYFLRSGETARELLAYILEESDEEKNKYTDDEAEHFLTYLIYSQLSKHATISF